MRLIGTVYAETAARKIAHLLGEKGIEASVEPEFDAQTGLLSYQVWAHDEDRIDEAKTLFAEFQQHPEDRRYDLPPEPPPPLPPPERRKPWLTILLCSICIFFYLIDLTQIRPVQNQDAYLFTPLQAALLYDFPAPFARFVETPNQQTFNALQTSPYFQGLYASTVAKLRGEDPSLVQGPMFTDIRRGEIYRIITPILLHGGLLHILFNLLWLWVLAGPIEERIGAGRLLLMVVIIGAISNTAQYLMSGPFFLGISGVVAGLAGFMWVRQRKAPWEGYPMARSTFIFLALFLIAMFALSVVSFFTQSFTNLPLTPNIANTAHLIGAAVGMLLGTLPMLARRLR